MGKTQHEEKSDLDEIVETDDEKATDPRQLLDDLLKRTEEMEKRLARLLEDCENLGVFDDARRVRRGPWSRFFGG